MTGSAEAQETVPLPERIGQYTILCQLDQGGMATLFLGRALGLGGFDRLFAIKLIHEHLSREKRFVDMFLDEARLAARISHPNVVSVYEIGIDRGRHFIAMDYINGETFSSALQQTWGKGKPLPSEIAAHVVSHAAEGLHAAHELKGSDGRPLGVVHRDVAPSNVMLGYDGMVRVMDFGVAKARDQLAHTKPGTIKGTLAYMAPEHVRSKVLDRRADIWSLGVVLWEALVGKRLFKGRNDIETTERLLRRRVKSPSELNDGVPTQLEDIVMRALRRDPEQRFETSREMGEALQNYLANQRVRVGPADVELFMRNAFETRYEWRQELQRRGPTAQPVEFREFETLMEPGSNSEAQMELLSDPEDLIEVDVSSIPPDELPDEAEFDAKLKALETPPTEEASQTPDLSGELRSQGLLIAREEPPKPPASSRLEAIVHNLTVEKGAVEAPTEDAPNEGSAEAQDPAVPISVLDAEPTLSPTSAPTQVIRTERALAKARESKAATAPEARTFLFAWRDRSVTDPEVREALRNGVTSRAGWIVILLVLGGLFVAGLTLSRSDDSDAVAHVSPIPAEPAPASPVAPEPPAATEAETPEKPAEVAPVVDAEPIPTEAAPSEAASAKTVARPEKDAPKSVTKTKARRTTRTKKSTKRSRRKKKTTKKNDLLIIEGGDL